MRYFFADLWSEIKDDPFGFLASCGGTLLEGLYGFALALREGFKILSFLLLFFILGYWTTAHYIISNHLEEPTPDYTLEDPCHLENFH